MKLNIKERERERERELDIIDKYGKKQLKAIDKQQEQLKKIKG